jgi:hypothetical protein
VILHSFFNDVATSSSVRNSINYEATCWAEELLSAKPRAFGVSIAKAAEVFILAGKPIKAFLDIGTGLGLFLDGIFKYLPDTNETFLGVQIFPPEIEFQNNHPGIVLDG